MEPNDIDLDELAATAFEPVDFTVEDLPKLNESLAGFGNSMRIACSLAGMDKDRLVAFCKEVEGENANTLVGTLKDSKELAEHAAQLMDSTIARLIVAMAVIANEEAAASAA